MDKKTIAFDIDGVWTEDPEAFSSIYDFLTTRGHTCIMVTGAAQPQDKLDRLGLTFKTIIVADKILKSVAARQAGYEVDIWIDDRPEFINPPALQDNLE